MNLPREALELIEHFEGYHDEMPDGRARPYLCPAKVATIGIGSTFYEDGEPVRLTNPPITRERAYELLAFELRQCEAAVDRLTPGQPPLARGALVSFAYNLGAGALRGSTLRRKLNAGDIAGAAREFGKWTLAGGVRLRGLERRRAAEAAMFLAGHQGDAHAAAPRAGGPDAVGRGDHLARHVPDHVVAAADAGSGEPAAGGAGTPAASVDRRPGARAGVGANTPFGTAADSGG